MPDFAETRCRARLARLDDKARTIRRRLHEGAGAGIHRVQDLPGLKITPSVRRAIESHLLPVIAGGS